MSEVKRAPDETDIVAYAPGSARNAIAEIRDLSAVASYEQARPSQERLEQLGFVLEGGEPLEDQANWLLDETPLSVEMETTFEVVLESSEPDRRICFECRSMGRFDDRDHMGYEIHRVYYRYSWSGSSEVELTGDERQIAETFGRRVVPELSE